ncbi:uncharacterized protein LOC125647914 isoform X3 [Ostrea edulis]|uniref:uncharacterized protein LOC125647914 isoform X3 n=1 Tax=Ostrea edulis TaxID=37623 RepID=UPI002095D2A5|nr:uncharacterized protein LOC125647914 isoform X3 [Ostrea edulis]
MSLHPKVHLNETSFLHSSTESRQTSSFKDARGKLIKDTNTRVRALIKAADEGRKRANALPPLPMEREPTFHRPPRGFVSLQNPEEAGESHWQRKFKKVSFEIDRKVVTHLRRKLNKRLDDKFHSLEVDSDEEKQTEQTDKKTDRKISEKEDKNIFTKYSDLGEKILYSKSRRKSKGSHTNENERKKHGESHDGAKSNGKLPSKSLLPEINNQEQLAMDNEVRDEKTNGHVTESEESDEEITELAKLNGKNEESSVLESFRDLVVSPVQTPVVFRPITRHRARENSDTVADILKGGVHPPCIAESKSVTLYVSSGFTDTVAERTCLIEKVYPELHTYCRHFGFELQIYDLRWGLKDQSTDDHGLPTMCLKYLEKCQETACGGIVLVVLGDKYGPYILPSTIPVVEFQAIYEQSLHQRKQKVELMRKRVAEIEKATEERESKKQQGLTEGEIMEDVGRDHLKLQGLDLQLEPPAGKEALNVFRNHADMIKREQQIIKALKEKEESMPSPHLLRQWYKLDDNCRPPVYRLQNISSVIKEYSRGDARTRESGRLMWNETVPKLRKLLNEFADVAIRDQQSRKNYFSSLLEQELDQCLVNNDEVTEDIVVINRNITDLHSNLGDSAITDYADLHPTQEKTLSEAETSYMNKLKTEIITEKVDNNHILNHDVDWDKGGIQPVTNRSHHVYLDRMSKQVLEVLKREFSRHISENMEQKDATSKLYQEISQHVSLCQERGQHFQGRRELLQTVKSYIRSKCRLPLILHGKAGCGKTALVCKVALEIQKWCKGLKPHVIIRAIGRTTASRNVRTLLRSICLQLCHVFGGKAEEVPMEFKGLVNDFPQRISQASEMDPLIVILDSVDQLTEEHEGNKMAWLPKDLPENVKLIITTNPDEQFESFPGLMKAFGSNKDITVAIPSMPQEDAESILEYWLQQDHRVLIRSQFDVIINAFNKCAFPLYLKLAFMESKLWSSFTDIEHCKLSENIIKLAALKFGKLETKHGEPLVRRALGYITASREGITSNEMEDILSIDEAVMDDVIVNLRPAKRRFPNVLWIRLLEDLSDLLTPTLTHGVITYVWAHSQFNQAADERYLQNRDKAPSYHKTMAEYFQGIWASKPKPYMGNEKGVLRCVSEQRLYYEPCENNEDGSDRIYNIRKVNELPYHLLNSQQTSLYKSEALCNFEWINAKLCGTSLRSLVEEYQTGLAVEPTDSELKMMSDVIQLSAKALSKDPRQLAAQIVGRLTTIIANDIPRAPGDPPRYPFIHMLLKQAHEPSLPALIPSIRCLTEPGGILFDLLSGHTDPITAVEVSTDGGKAFTASRDNTMKMWDLRTGKVMKTINDVGTNITRIRVGYNVAFVVTVEGNVMQVWNVRYSERVLRVDKYPDPPVIGMAGEGKYLCALFDGNNKLRTWNLNKAGHPMISEAQTENHRVYNDNSALISPFSFDERILHASRGANCALVNNVRNGKQVLSLKCNDYSSAVTSLGTSRDYFIVACRQHYMHLHEIYQLELFDLKKGRYLRSVRGCIHDKIKDLFINYIGSHAIAICASEETNTSDISVWNIETEDHKHLARHAGASVLGACADFKYCLTAGKNDKTLNIWNLTSKINQSMPRLKKQSGVFQILAMTQNPRYVVSRQFNNGPVSVWNVARAKQLKTAVRIERSLSDSSDVVVVRDTKVVILTEKGIANAKDNARPVFQTVLIYDLLQKKFVKKIKKCFITPCPSHEYVMLKDEMLLGLSENRSHFVIWNLKTGQVEHRIRPLLKDLEKKIAETDVMTLAKERCHTAKLTPWERRVESQSAKQRRRDAAVDIERQRVEELKKEISSSGIDRYLLSGDQKIAVASFFAHFMCVFDIENHAHLATLESDTSMLSLLVASLTYTGNYLVQANYDEEQRTSYVTLWDCFEGVVKKRLRNESDVMALGLSEDASKIIIGKDNKEIHIWEPNKSPSLRKIQGVQGLEFNDLSKIFIVDNDTRAVVFAGDISVWDIERGVVLAVFSPDTKITCCHVANSGRVITFGLHDIPEIVILKLMSSDLPSIEDEGQDMFGEKPAESSDEDDEEEEEEA